MQTAERSPTLPKASRLKFPASHSINVDLGLSADLTMERARAAAARMGWKLVMEQSEELRFTVGLSWMSWGEQVTMRIYAGRVLVESRCRLPTQCEDWNKNRTNCLEFVEALRSAPL